MAKICPIIQGVCLEHGCEFFTHLIGKNPQTGAEEDKWGCAINFLPILLVENALATRSGNASMDKVATEIHKIADIPIQIKLQPVFEPIDAPLQLKNGSPDSAA